MKLHFNGQQPNFRFITLREPLKEDLVRFLDTEHNGTTPVVTPIRCARVQVVLRTGQARNNLYELIVNLDAESVAESHFLDGKHSHIDTDYMKTVEEACMSNAEVQRQIKLLDLPEGSTVVIEPWAYATDGMNDMSQRTSMVGTLLISSYDNTDLSSAISICA